MYIYLKSVHIFFKYSHVLPSSTVVRVPKTAGLDENVYATIF